MCVRCNVILRKMADCIKSIFFNILMNSRSCWNQSLPLYEHILLKISWKCLWKYPVPTVYPWMFCKTCLELATITKGSLAKSNLGKSLCLSYVIKPLLHYNSWWLVVDKPGLMQENHKRSALCFLFFNKGLFWQVRYSDGEVLGHFYYFLSFSEWFWSIM